MVNFLNFSGEYFIPIIVISLVALIIILGYYYSDKNRILRSMSKARSLAINKAQTNKYVKISGKALNVKKPLIAPISGRHCVMYQIHVEIKRKNWDTLIKETVRQDFFLEKNGEMAIIKMDQPKGFRRIYLERDKKARSGFLNDATPRLEGYLRKHGKESTNFFGMNSSIRYREGIIALNETVTVQGIADWKTLNKPIEGFNYSKILTLSGSKNQKLLITDLKKALAPDKI